MSGFRLIAFLQTVCLVCAAGCSQGEAPIKISLANRETVRTAPHSDQEKPLRIAVGGMITPQEGFVYYKEFLDYLGEKIGRPVQFVDKEKYEEVNNLLKSGDIDVAFVCSGPYVDGHDEFGLELLAAPQAYGKTVYYSYIIAERDSPIADFEELRGKTFAFADPQSNSGTLVPTYMLSRLHETPDSFFKQYVYTYAHDKSIVAVAQKVVDGAAVDSLIWEYLNRANPKFTSKTKIIAKSPPYGIPPVVARKGLDRKLKKALHDALVNAHNDERGRELLNSMMIDRFVDIRDSDYDSVRAMKVWLARQKRKGA